ncbi:MAG: hypothetical protein RL637_1766 [Pseudomonadota bacterium]|jgi:diguanylate cyclase (GGDEF)-like protein/PAS domain S-box-containing protein
MDTLNYQVLLVEDEASDAHLVRIALKTTIEIHFELRWVTTLGLAQQQLTEQLPDVLLLDLSLPDSLGLNSLIVLRSVAKYLPIIVLTGHDDTTFALQALEAGAQDYLVKGSTDNYNLIRAIRYAISRAKLERKLQISEQRMSLALSGGHLGLWDWHIPSGKVFFNEIWAQMLGYSLEEIDSNISTWEHLIHPEDREQVSQKLSEHIAGKTKYYQAEHRLLHKNSEWIWINDVGQIVERDNQGQPIRAVGIHQNINQRKQVETKDRLLVSALEAVGLGVVITDISAKIIWVNRAFEQLTGYSFTEAIGHRPAELVKSGLQDGYFYQQMWNTVLRGEVWCGELVNRRKDGSLYYEELTITPVFDEQGNISHFVGIKQDISDRKQLQEKLWTMATIDELTGLINRRYFMIRIAEEFNRFCTSNNENDFVAVLMIDLDHFKRINDNYGHQAGDVALKHFADIVRSYLRIGDIVGRLGGEEFAIFLPKTSLKEAEIFANQFVHKLHQTPCHYQLHSFQLSVSIGITLMQPDDSDSGQSLIRADKALYQAKARGRNQTVIYSTDYDIFSD